MSMHNWPEYGLGLVIRGNEPVLDVLSRALVKEYGTIEGGYCEDVTDPDLLNDMAEKIGFVRWYNDDSSDGRSFCPLFSGHGEGYEHADMLAFFADRQPAPFEAAYTEESLVREFRKKLGRYLPEDFDYLAHIGYFSCSVCC